MRRHLGLILRIFVSGGILAWLAFRLDFRKIGGVAAAMEPGWMVGAVLLFIPIAWLAMERWRLLLEVQGIHLSRGQSLQLFMVGHFFNAFLLGTTGGDVVKMFYVSQAAPGRKSAAALSVLMDRVVGLIALLALAAVFSGWHYPFLAQKPETAAAVWSVFAFSGAALSGIGLAWLLPWFGKMPFFARYAARLPLRATLQNLHDALVRYLKAPGAFGGALLLAFVLHGLSFAMNYGAARALWGDMLPPPLVFLCILPVILFLTAIPVSISGLGIREGLSVLFFGLAGVPPEQATAMGLAVFFINLLWSLVGGVVYLTYESRLKRSANFSPVRS
jgi:uncharacterized membrane protein YbhN (UPF0104 family)